MSIHVYRKSLPNLPSPQESPLDSSSDHLYLIAHWLKISKGESSLVITTCSSSVHSWESVPNANSDSLASPCDSQGGLWVYPSSVCFVMIWCFHGATVSLSFFCNILPCFLSVLQLTLTFPPGFLFSPLLRLGPSSFVPFLGVQSSGLPLQSLPFSLASALAASIFIYDYSCLKLNTSFLAFLHRYHLLRLLS